MTCALVTGAAGFVGRWMVQALDEAGWEVMAVDRRAGKPAARVRWIPRDLASERLVEAADVLVHLAFPPREHVRSDRGTATVLETLDRNVIEAAGRARRTVVFSSAAVYGEHLIDDARFDERTTPAPVSPYGRVKLEQEGRWRAALPEGRLLVVRPFNLTGPGEPPALVVRAMAERLRAAAPDTPLPVRRSASVRDFMDVRDAARAVVALLSTGVTGTANVCSGSPTTIGQLAERLRLVSGRAIRLEPDGQGADSRSVGDRAALERCPVWRPRYDLDESLREVWREVGAGSPLGQQPGTP